MTTKLCYVCMKEIIPRKVNAAHYDPKHLDTFAVMHEGHLVRRADMPVYIGQDLYRHEKCEAGSAAWMKYQRSLPKRRRSEFYEIYKIILDKKENL